jgi:arylamine N-acetyltransferase
VDAVSYFKFVRDIPFRMPITVDDPDHTCVRKHVVMKTLLSSLGFKVRYALCRFSWSSLNIPESLKEIPHEDVVHAYLEVYNEEQARWMTVDATWDKGLASKLPLSEWDGKSDTVIAVEPSERLKPIESDEELGKFYNEQDDQQWLMLPLDSPLKVNGKFYDALNRWVESVRT